MLTAVLLGGWLAAVSAGAAVYYVNAGNPAPVPPYASWDTAATNIQDAINVTANGDTVLVTNGTYGFGGQIMAGTLLNRVALTNAITVQSVNGPWMTTILGGGETNGAAAVRCAWLTNGATLAGFTLTAGATFKSGDTATLESGGGAWCASSNALVSNCVIVSNTAGYYGAGVYQGAVYNSLIITNGTASSDDAAYKNILVNCTVVSNGASSIYGVVYPLAMTNCIVYFNGSSGDSNYRLNGGAFSHCCTTPALSGVGNITAAPLLFADGVHLTTNSPCIGAGINVAKGTDIFSQTWSNPPSMGCAEWQPSPEAALPHILLTGVPVGFNISSAFTGVGACACFWLKDGSTLQDNGHFNGTQTAALTATGVGFADAGAYQIVVSNSFGVVTSAVAQLVVHCVDVNGTNPTAPYTTWAAAATNIQDAITASAAGDVVLVTNGLYATGGKSEDGVITNRVAVDKAILVQSVNGLAVTTIQGAWDPTSTNGPGAIRSVWLGTNAMLSGFTVCGGATRAYSSSTGQTDNGGGIWGPAISKVPLAVADHCLIVSNAAAVHGGGAYQVNLNYCTLATNVVFTANGSSGGGAYLCALKNCSVTGNGLHGSNSGGGVGASQLTNCAVTLNWSEGFGGGANSSTLINCTVTKNQIVGSNPGYGGGVDSCTLMNCLVYGNVAPNEPNYNNYSSGIINYSCVTPAASGTSNLVSDPLLLADGIHLAPNSPCIGAGNSNVISGADIDGQPWNNPPSMGCDEWRPQPVMAVQPTFQAGWLPHRLSCSVTNAGQPPFAYFWIKDGQAIQDNGHYFNSSTANLTVNNFGPDDAGLYQVVITNSSGATTSAVEQLVIHVANAAGTAPVAPYSTWATAATNIQDAINSASAGDIVLVTNGIYVSGGLVMSGDLTNRVALNKVITVTSVNGAVATVIQGAWDPTATNGPGAVRCAYVGDGALLSGFTLENGATRTDSLMGGPLDSGGGVYCYSANGLVSDCVLTNDQALYGGGIANGTLYNSLVVGNRASSGGGVYASSLINCTVENNSARPGDGSGIYADNFTSVILVRNCIVLNNFDSFLGMENDFYEPGSSNPKISYSCCPVTIYGSGNSNNLIASPQLMDMYHIAATSPCRGTGSAAYATGTDLDGEAWGNPPSMGCSEVVLTNLVGPLSATITSADTNLLVNHIGGYGGIFTGHAAGTAWNFGDGVIVTNIGPYEGHTWTHTGSYPVTFTVYNNDNPAGVSASLLVKVVPINPPPLGQITVNASGAFQFQFAGQTNATYYIQYATNLVPPVTWNALKTIYYNQQATVQISDTAVTNIARFYRVLAQ
jgi:hypothetical protein